jgi:hypothetical protein
MSVKIGRFGRLQAVATGWRTLATMGLISCSTSQNDGYFFWLYPYEKYGIDKHFQYHLINYNGQTAYAALTLEPLDNNGDDYELYPAIPALRLRCSGTALRQADDGDPSH